MLFTRTLLFASLVASGLARIVTPRESTRSSKDATVLVLGGGVTGVIAARTLHESGIDDFIIVEALGELGGRMMDHVFGAPGKEYVVEAGCNWVSPTRSSAKAVIERSVDPRNSSEPYMSLLLVVLTPAPDRQWACKSHLYPC
jgi:hypothetical protein